MALINSLVGSASFGQRTPEGPIYNWHDLTYPTNAESNTIRINPGITFNVTSPVAINIVATSGGSPTTTAIAADTPTNFVIATDDTVQFTITQDPGDVVGPAAVRVGASDGRLVDTFGLFGDPDTQFFFLINPQGDKLNLDPSGVDQLLWR